MVVDKNIEMMVVTVIPITKGFFGENLSYFTSRAIEPGSVVSVPLRKKSVPALVVTVEPLRAKKTDIKSLSFGLRPLGEVVPRRLFTVSFIEAMKQVSVFTAAPLGHVIKSFAPKALLELPRLDAPVMRHHAPSRFERVAIQAPNDERLSFYKSLIREEFARKKSVLFVVPSVADAERLRPMLEKGIEGYAIVLHNGISKKRLAESWVRIATEDHPILVLATPGFLSVPRSDFGALVVEQESSPHYKSGFRPFVDARSAIVFLAQALGTRVILGDSLLRIETIYEYENGTFVTLLPLKFRALSGAEQVVASMREDTNSAGGVKKFQAVGTLLRNAIDVARGSGGGTFLYVHRKGLAPLTTCQDCGSYVPCARCKAPVVLHKSDEGNFFLCHKCWKEYPADTLCSHCGSWRLLPLGVGIEAVFEEVAEAFPDRQLFRIDGDTVKSHTAARKILADFYESPGAILIGTELAVPYLSQPIDTVGIVSIDSLFSLPDFRVHEKIFHTGIALRAVAHKQFVIQTRAPERKIFEYITRGNLVDFYRDELNLRRKFAYPPFKILVKITREGPAEAVSCDMDALALELVEWKPAVFPGFGGVPDGHERLHILLRLEPKQWPHESLARRLSGLPPAFVVTIDPEDIV